MVSIAKTRGNVIMECWLRTTNVFVFRWMVETHTTFDLNSC